MITNDAVLALAQRLRAGGASFQSIAFELNRLGLPCARGGRWYAASVRALLAQLSSLQNYQSKETPCSA